MFALNGRVKVVGDDFKTHLNNSRFCPLDNQEIVETHLNFHLKANYLIVYNGTIIQLHEYQFRYFDMRVGWSR